MAVFYHIDRSQGCMFEILRTTSIIKELNKSYNNTLYDITKFEEGLSNHGITYLVSDFKNTRINPSLALKEFVFEMVRQAYFPQAFSRYQSMYAFKDMENLYKFIDRYYKIKNNHIDFTVYTLESEKNQEYDMNWFSQSEENINELTKNALNYWSAIKTENPIMEILLKPEIRIIKRLAPCFKFKGDGNVEITFGD